MAFQIYGKNYLKIDLSPLNEQLEILKKALTQQQFERLMLRTLSETARKVKTIVAKDVVQDYAVTQQWVKSAFGSYTLGMGGEFPVTCTIPISGVKGVIGPRFKLTGRKRSLRTKIVKTGISTLPPTMKNQGGNPPFVGPNGVVFTRKFKNKKKPIVRVVGVGVPQMPLNRSEDAVGNDIVEFMRVRIDHNFHYMFGG